MSQTFYVATLMSVALVLMALSGIAENLITRQMDTSTYRYVRLLWLLRRAYVGAAVCILAFSVSIIQTVPLSLGLAALVLGVIAGLLVEMNSLLYRNWRNVVRCGLVPSIAVTMSIAGLASTLNLGIPVLLIAGLIVLQVFVINKQIAAQDWITIRD